jgi:DNA-directed RNA polymerase subunit RPC12/RpoP
MVTHRCASCGHTSQVQDWQANTRATCPRCGQVSQVPASTPEATPQPGPLAAPDASRIIKFHCSKCRQKIGMRTSDIGEQVHCPHCGTVLRVWDEYGERSPLLDVEEPPARTGRQPADMVSGFSAYERDAPASEVRALAAPEPRRRALSPQLQRRILYACIVVGVVGVLLLAGWLLLRNQ